MHLHMWKEHAPARTLHARTLRASELLTERRCMWQVWDLNARKAKKTDYVAAAQTLLARP